MGEESPKAHSGRLPVTFILGPEPSKTGSEWSAVCSVETQKHGRKYYSACGPPLCAEQSPRGVVSSLLGSLNLQRKVENCSRFQPSGGLSGLSARAQALAHSGPTCASTGKPPAGRGGGWFAGVLRSSMQGSLCLSPCWAQVLCVYFHKFHFTLEI